MRADFSMVEIGSVRNVDFDRVRRATFKIAQPRPAGDYILAESKIPSTTGLEKQSAHFRGRSWGQSSPGGEIFTRDPGPGGSQRGPFVVPMGGSSGLILFQTLSAN